LIAGQNTLMLVECDRVLAMVPGDRSGKLAEVPLVTSAASAQQPQVVPTRKGLISAAQQQQAAVVMLKNALEEPGSPDLVNA
jgi:hypothetical protein